MIPVIESGATRDPVSLRTEDILTRLNAKGAVLLRGFDFDLAALEAFTRNFCEGFHVSATRADKRQKGGDTYTTEVYRDNYTLFAHAEGAYKPYPRAPEACFFMCMTPPAVSGGETTVIDGVAFLKEMPAALRDRFARVGMTYEMTWDKKRWQDEFELDTLAELKALLPTLPAVRHKLDGDTLHLFFTTPAIIKTRRGQPAFANGLLAHLPRCAHPGYAGKVVYTKATNRVYFGDGEELSDSIVNQLIDVQDKVSYAHAWQAKDVLFLDNTRHMHGRTMTSAPCERVLISRFGMLKPSA